jgi:hypothetical protein
MGITEISDVEIVKLIGADPAIAAAAKNGEEKQQAQQQMAEENESVVAEFRSLQVCCSTYVLPLASETVFFRQTLLTGWYNFISCVSCKP